MRSIWKLPFHQNSMKKKASALLRYQNLPSVIIRSRESTILPVFEGQSFKVYTGNRYVWFNPSLAHLGFKFGDFALTKKRCVFRVKNKGKGTKG